MYKNVFTTGSTLIQLKSTKSPRIVLEVVLNVLNASVK